MKMSKRILAMLLAVLMVASIAPMSVMQAAAENITEAVSDLGDALAVNSAEEPAEAPEDAAPADEPEPSEEEPAAQEPAASESEETEAALSEEPASEELASEEPASVEPASEYILNVYILGPDKDGCNKVWKIVDSALKKECKTLKKIDARADLEFIQKSFGYNNYAFFAAAGQTLFDNVQKADTVIINLRNNIK